MGRSVLRICSDHGHLGIGRALLGEEHAFFIEGTAR